MLYGIFCRNICGNETDFVEESDFLEDYFTSKSEAEKIAKELTENFADDSWLGHRFYENKFFAREVSNEYIRHRQETWANIRTANMMM